MLRAGGLLLFVLSGALASFPLLAQQFGRTPLMEAASLGRAEEVRALARTGANVDATDQFGDTALLWAAFQGSWPAVVDTLLELGAVVDRPSRTGRTPLMQAAGVCSPNHQRIVEALIRRGASINRRDDLGYTPLYLSAASGTEACSRLLLAAGADATIASRDGDTPLSAAAFHNNVPAMTALLQAGADPNARQANGNSVLMTAAIRGHARAVETLLAAKADANARIPDGRGVLMLMLGTPDPSPEIMSRLIAAGANPNWTDQTGRTALKLARVRGNLPEVEKVLVQAGGRE